MPCRMRKAMNAIASIETRPGSTPAACAISTDALDRLDPAFKIVLSQREVQFLRLRDRIEMKVQEKFRNKETEGKPPGIVLRMTDF